jgi:hypothetical protein
LESQASKRQKKETVTEEENNAKPVVSCPLNNDNGRGKTKATAASTPRRKQVYESPPQEPNHFTQIALYYPGFCVRPEKKKDLRYPDLVGVRMGHHDIF